MGDMMSLSRVLNHQGFNALALKEWADARITFQDSLKTAHEGGIIPVMLNALIGLAALQIQQKASPETLALILFILQHPSSNQETKELAKRLLPEAKAQLTQEEINVAQEDATLNDLDKFTHGMLDTFSL
jgi:hypothetical protein